ncbi:MAG: PolC-type DNA polymerase III [Bacilli bacterium]|nr:PolC-type DNA polymerase III [Bacilli bacterium]
MLDNKMVRFLKSIHIDNIDDFDLSFEMASYDRFKKDQFNMVILKDTPWKYHLLHQFQESLNYITYKYLLRFSYRVRPNNKDVMHLFEEWYQSIYHIPHNINIVCLDNEHIVVTYASNAEKEQYKDIINDFKAFLNFINYEFVVMEKVEEAPTMEEEKPLVSERKMKTLLKQAENVVSDNDNDNDNPYQTLEDIAKQQKDEMNEEVSKRLLEIEEENLKAIQKERQRNRLNRRGNYSYYENIDSINASSGNVEFDGYCFSIEIKAYGKKRFTIGVGDHLGGAIYVSGVVERTITEETINAISYGQNIRVCGVSYLDDFTHQLTIKAHNIDLLPPDEVVPEKNEKHRVELHLHTKMSAMDGVSNMSDYARYAKKLGHTAIAITDHAVTQGYPDAQKAAKDNDIKMLYGVEFYMVDDQLNFIKNPAKRELVNAKYVVLDLETTGLSARYNKIIEFGAVKIENGIEVDRLDILINPEEPLPKKISEITNITDAMLKGQPTIKEALNKIVPWMEDAILVTHNADFDFSFLQEALVNNGMDKLTNPVIDTLSLSRYLFPESRRHRLGNLCRAFEVYYDEESAHRADYDAHVLNEVWQPMIVLLTKDNPNLTHEDLGKLITPNEALKHIRPLHLCAIAKDKIGLKQLYKLVTLSHVDYLADVPKIPRRELLKLRDHLIIGSACFNGEVFRTAQYYNKETLKSVMSFYDYIEIQPLENYSFLWNIGDSTKKDITKYLLDIVECADELNIPVCATGDVHYLSKNEKQFRDVYIFAKGLGNTLHPLNPYNRSSLPPFENPDQHFLTTDEMLEAMNFLGEEKAYEVTVTNTNLIADMVEPIVPLPNDKLYTPHMEHCEEDLTAMVYKKAHEYYGDPLPQLIEERLKAELDGIISNGFTVIYMIAHKLIKKANDDGYIVGSRGSVGSSLVATMSDITEVNPLPPHYRCPKCKRVEWINDTDPSIRSGFDVEDKACPICGTNMIHDGQNIPFQTFLGFHAEKVPDIDLNFPPDYQAFAHQYTKVLLGENNVFRAGTIATVAEKTAYGHARNYVEKMGFNPDEYSKAKLSRLAAGCVDVKRTTGQHPGGIVVVPDDYEVFDFTPVQYPADDKQADWLTTHFDFHSIHDTILKLDLLGHVDPLALKMMQDLTKLNIHNIPMNDKKVLSLFTSSEALGMKHDYLANKTGASAIPEFGTENSKRILEETNPTKFSDLVIISGLSHGTNVWADNAEKLIQNKIATLREVIGCRDDIMTYLIAQGLPDNIAFKIMEDVRKGKGLKPEYAELMKANKVPQYYIDSCNLIKYLFPKGHAVAYVTQAVRVGYYKVYYPLEFYATFFSVRCDQYDIEAMIAGEEAIIHRIDELRAKERNSRFEKMTPKEVGQLDTLKIALEMVQRGYKFSNIDLYRSDATNFVVDYENKCLIPPFITIDGLGQSNAMSVIEARKNGRFLSKEDLGRRTRLSSTNIDVLKKLGVLNDLDESDQMSLFDF